MLTSQPGFSQDNLFSACSVCYGSTWFVTYQNGVRGAKRCPNAVWNEEKKKHVCHLNSVTTGQIAHKQNQDELLKLIRKLVVELRINGHMFLAAMKEYFKVSDLQQLNFQQLELILLRLRLAGDFKSQLIRTNQIPQVSLSKVA